MLNNPTEAYDKLRMYKIPEQQGEEKELYSFQNLEFKD